jgi:hypothetical protein
MFAALIQIVRYKFKPVVAKSPAENLAGKFPDIRYFSPMTQVTALLKEACKLDLLDRAELVSSLLEDLDSNPHWVSDEEALVRHGELKSGKVKGLTEEEFWKACGRA